MPREAAVHYFDRCIKWGLLILNTKDADGDNKEETKNDEEIGTEDMIKSQVGQ